MSILLSVEHAYATGVADMKKAARFITASVLPALKAVDANASTIEAVSGLVSPQLADIERASEAVLGVVIKAIEDTVAAGNAGGVSITLDSALVSDIKALIPAVKSAAPKAA